MDFSQTVNLFDAHSIISTLGLVGILAIIFMETGLLIGLFFPGDSLLFLSGIGASGAAAKIFDGVQIEIIPLLIGAPLVAIIGSQTGYFIGAKYGVKLFDRPDGRVFNQKKVKSTERWLNKYGTGKVQSLGEGSTLPEQILALRERFLEDTLKVEAAAKLVTQESEGTKKTKVGKKEVVVEESAQDSSKPTDMFDDESTPRSKKKSTNVWDDDDFPESDKKSDLWD